MKIYKEKISLYSIPFSLTIIEKNTNNFNFLANQYYYCSSNRNGVFDQRNFVQKKLKHLLKR